MTDRPDPMAPETVIVDTHKVSCDGDNGALGHPLVWMEMGKDEVVVCRYCDRQFILRCGKADPDRR